jgi:DNA-binding LacI/PurR family transcriptional regulator
LGLQRRNVRKRTTTTKDPVRRKRGIHAVAEHAGVSIATVSRVVSGVKSVDQKLSRKVWKAVSELEYVPNRNAQALISGRTSLIGLLVPDIMNPFYPELIHGFEHAATAQGFGILIGSTHDIPSETEVWVQRMLQHGVEGLALLTFKEEYPQVSHMLKNTPIVQIETGKNLQGPGIIAIDYEPGIRQAVQHLAVLGHRDIMFAAGEAGDFTAELRRNAFRKAMREIGIVAKEAVIDETHTLEGGIAAARRILRRKARPTALICSNDLMAIGALKMLRSSGLNVPRDISLIGLDDIHLAEFTMPPLTTVRLPRTQLAEACFNALFQQLRPKKGASLNHVVSTSLVIRESTDFPPRAQHEKAGRRQRNQTQSPVGS